MAAGPELLMAFGAGLGLGGLATVPEVQDIMLDSASTVLSTADQVGEMTFSSAVSYV